MIDTTDDPLGPPDDAELFELLLEELLEELLELDDTELDVDPVAVDIVEAAPMPPVPVPETSKSYDVAGASPFTVKELARVDVEAVLQVAVPETRY